ncbi:hypothetical protein OG239_05460 [Streptomyces sp. NBC_00868]|uniref:hypothetical protein n=1 Tax=unclassified Streptomyces TaxID=2593676 RepID=UPI0032558291|nr:hypothetical protein OG239_05460 [Streptomyces sp. NBC_00868]
MSDRRHGGNDIHARFASVFDLDARLPGMVFRRDAGDTLFVEFDVLLTPDLWPALCTMARWHGDQHVELLVLAPDDDKYSFPALSLSVEASVDDYWDAVGFGPDDDAGDSVTIMANVVALTGPSRKWGCWGERDPEVAVFQGFPDAAARDAWREEFGPFLEVDEALNSYLSLAFRGAVPDWYASALTAHYRNSGCSGT